MNSPFFSKFMEALCPKTGFGADDDSDSLDFLRKAAALIKVLMKQCMSTAEQFAHACGRTNILDRDVMLALKYEARMFFQRDFDADFMTALAEEQEHTYETDESEEEDEGEDEEDEGEDEEDEGEDEEDEDESEEEEEEAWTGVCVSTDHALRVLHAQVVHHAAQWDAWQPTDQVQQFLKRSIDNTEAKCGLHV